MFYKSNLFRGASALCLALTLTIFAFGDTIRLKDGSLIKGKIVTFGGGKFVVLVGDGTRQRQLSYTANEVESISFDGSAMPSATSNSANNGGSNNNNNSTIITVGRTNPDTSNTSNNQSVPQISTPLPAPPKVVTSSTTATVAPKPIEVGVKVLADNTANGWTNSGWVVRKGQKIKITGTGRISLGGGRYATPGGIASLPDKDKLMQNQATGGLIAVIGDNNNDFIYVGDALEFTATQDGALFLGINEGNLADNSGAFDIKIEISPERSY